MPARGVRLASAGMIALRAVCLCSLCALSVLSASFPVSNSNDSGNGSLRQAILDANENPGPDTITFQLSGSGVRTITPVSTLPPLLEAVVLEGATQPGYAGQPLVELNGVTAGNNAGLRVLAGGCTVRGLAINRFGGSGIQIEGAGTNVVQACCIGVDSAGTTARPNGLEGIWVYNSSGNIIGGTNISSRNVISGNSGSGVYVQNGAGNLVLGNMIGTTAAGTGALGNRNNGVVIYNAPGNVVGGSDPGARNVISANGASGVYLLGTGSVANRIQGNYIGTTITGGAALSNAADGITLSGAGGNIIGGTNAGEGNLVSGNGKAGIGFSGSGTANNVVHGNLIGTSVSGTTPVGNGYAGMWLSGAVSNRIGGDTSSARNVISGNRQDGLLLTTNSAGNIIGMNHIGVDRSGVAALPNLFCGIAIVAAHSNVVGGLVSSMRNVISGNAYDGVLLSGGSSGNVIEGNYIGTDLAGTRPLANGRAGIGISAAPRNLIGGFLPGAGNVISANGDAGIYLIDPAANGNQILGNSIGTDAAGGSALGNRLEGIYLESAPGNFIGTSAAGGGNLISGNHTRGVYLTNASLNRIENNYIGVALDGIVPVPNSFHNIEAEAGSANNIILFNRIAFAPAPYAGVRVRSASVNNCIQANSVFSNGALGINLGPAGVAVNDACDVDAGANNLQNSPVLSQVVTGAGTGVRGTFVSAANQSYVVQFFASPACDPSGFGEGQVYLGEIPVTTRSDCGADFVASLPVRVLAGWTLTATATDAAGNTSEFSSCVPVFPAPELDLQLTDQHQALLSWTNSPPGFVLKDTTSLNPPILWSTVTNQAVTVGGMFRLLLPQSAGDRFYTLQFQ